jgi:hypothetical protein
MDYLYALYDALVGINVPGDKARAVVDAMERDMGTTLATKTDLQMLKQELKQDIGLARQESKQDGTSLRQELKQEIASLRQELKQDIALLRQDLTQEIVLVRKDMELLRSSMTVRLGSMLFVGLGLLFAALRLT